MTALHVTSPGGASTIQDYGRPGYQRYGVPESGAMDRLALRIANRLVGNEENEACIEFAMLGGAYEAVDCGCRVAVAGGAFDVSVDGAPVPSYRSFDVPPGFAIPAVLGSRSTHVRSGIGGGVLTSGTLLPLRQAGAGAGPPRELDRRALRPGAGGPLRVVMGPQDDAFTAEGRAAFLEGSYRVGPQSDRMGYRLEGPAIAHAAGANIVSDGIALGSIQVPGTGQPIVLLADRQSTGGYPKIATLLSVDTRRLAQRRPDEPVTFVAVTPDEADAVVREDRAATATLLAAIRPASVGDLRDSARLLELNLIDGFINGEA